MPVKIFICYAHEDEALLNKLNAHLKSLERLGLIDVWHDRDINAGAEWEQEIKDQLNTAQIILLLVSPDFMDSDYSYGIEMQQALERHERGEAHVIPIILRPVYFEGTPFSTLLALPTDAKAVMSTSWQYPDEAYVNVTEGIRKVVDEIRKRSPPPSPPPPIQHVHDVSVVTHEDFSWRCIRTLTGHEDSVSSVAISADGQTLASGSEDKTIKLWNVKTGDPLRTLTGHKDSVVNVAISRDGRTLASGSMDVKIRLWDVKTGDLLRTLTRHKSSFSAVAMSVAMSADGQILASGSADKTIKLWEKQ